MNFKFLSLICISLLIGATGAKAAAFTDSGEWLLGFRATGGTGSASNLVVDLGTYSSILASPGGITLDYSSTNSVISTTYGSAWWTRNDLYWGVIASDNDTLNLYLSRITGTALPAGSDGTSPNIAASDLYTINGNVVAMAAASTAGNATYSTNNGYVASVSGTGNAGSWTAGQSIGWGFFPSTTDVVVIGNTNLSLAYYTWNMDDQSPDYGAGNTPLTLVATLNNNMGVITVVPEPSTYALALVGGLILIALQLRRRYPLN